MGELEVFPLGFSFAINQVIRHGTGTGEVEVFPLGLASLRKPNAATLLVPAPLRRQNRGSLEKTKLAASAPARSSRHRYLS